MNRSTNLDPMMKGWVKQPLTRVVAKGMRAATKGRTFLDGQRFRYEELKELWVSSDEHHLICTHDGDDLWQYWTDVPPGGGGWQLLSTHTTRTAAHNAALDAENAQPEVQPDSGLFVLASLGVGHRLIRVRCLSEQGPQLITGIFDRLGYRTIIEEVGEDLAVSR